MSSRSPGRAEARGPRDLGLWIALALLALFLASQYGYALAVAFINDDYVFLDKTRGASFPSLWKLEALAFHWYRPWSRELHYWTLQKLFGARELPFHLASFALALGIFGAYLAWVRRLAGGAAAAVAVAGLAAMAAWGVPLVWIAGVQDLWLLAFTLVFLHALAAGSRAGASLALALALVSKEAAVVLPGIAAAYRIVVERKGWGETLRWIAPLAAIVAVWAMFHPVLGGRLWRPIADAPEPGLHPPLALIGLRTLAVPFNLDDWPAPERGWGGAMWRAAPGALLLATLAWWGTRGRAPRAAPAAPASRARPGAVVRFGVAFAAVGWLPLLMPTLGWHAYYALLGALGAWLALGVTLARWPAAAVGAIAVLALLRGARAETPSRDWGSEWYQRRAASFVGFMRADLLRKLPEPPPHTRFYFVRVPSNVGFLAGDGPALRVWYGDPTLSGGYYPSYRPRSPAEPEGSDQFFRYDSLSGWVPVRRGPEDHARARQENPRWVVDHDMLARTLAQAGDWLEAAAEYQKLADAESLRAEFAYNAGVCFEAAQDSSRAARWYARAAALPSADEEMRQAARRLPAPRLPAEGGRR